MIVDIFEVYCWVDRSIRCFRQMKNSFSVQGTIVNQRLWALVTYVTLRIKKNQFVNHSHSYSFTTSAVSRLRWRETEERWRKCVGVWSASPSHYVANSAVQRLRSDYNTKIFTSKLLGGSALKYLLNSRNTEVCKHFIR